MTPAAVRRRVEALRMEAERKKHPGVSVGSPLAVGAGQQHKTKRVTARVTPEHAEVQFMEQRGRELFGEFLAGDLLQVAITRSIQLWADTVYRRQQVVGLTSDGELRVYRAPKPTS